MFSQKFIILVIDLIYPAKLYFFESDCIKTLKKNNLIDLKLDSNNAY